MHCHRNSRAVGVSGGGDAVEGVIRIGDALALAVDGAARTDRPTDRARRTASVATLGDWAGKIGTDEAGQT